MLVQPTTSKERYEVLDALRGFALFGILMANLYSFFGYNTLTSAEIVSLPVADRGVLFFIDWFIEGKFFGLFSILFGIGFGLQAARMAPDFFLAYWYRRMFVLLAIGLFHMVCIWNGDILTLYSLLGMLLPLFMNMSDRGLSRWIVFLLAMPIVMFFLHWFTSESAFWSSLSRYSAQLKVDIGFGDLSRLEMRTSDSAREVFFINALSAVPRPMSYLLSGRYPQVFGLFLIGLLLARQLPGLVKNRIPLTRTMIAAFLVGLVCSFAYAWTKAASGSYYSLTPIGAVQAIVLHIGAPLLSMGIGWVFLTAWHSAPESRFFRHLATLGRMALTNYLFQTSVSVLLFFGYGFALMGTLPFALLPLFAFGILFCQWVFSHYWLRYFRQGPLEIIWKRLAYVNRRRD
ncbi:MAG: DUF418 domain-containing protein [Woeseiaceae bacterium]|nr:DUF418 domain-containing protein [Woeseiaceae bacterium]